MLSKNNVKGNFTVQWTNKANMLFVNKLLYIIFGFRHYLYRYFNKCTNFEETSVIPTIEILTTSTVTISEETSITETITSSIIEEENILEMIKH